MGRFASFFLFAFVTAAGLQLGTAAVVHADEVQKCTTKDFKIPEVKKACADGGRKAAKALMKKAVKKAKAAGDDMKCKSCHKSLKTFELKGADSVDKLKKLL